MSVVMSEYEAIWRNVRTPRVSLTAVEYARAIHREQVEHSHQLAEKLMLILIGAFLAMVVFIPGM